MGLAISLELIMFWIIHSLYLCTLRYNEILLLLGQILFLFGTALSTPRSLVHTLILE